MADRLAGETKDILVAIGNFGCGWCAVCGDDVCAGAVFSLYLPNQVRTIGDYAMDCLWLRESAKLPSHYGSFLYH